MRIAAYIDAGCRPTNPGPGAAGAVIVYPDGRERRISTRLGHTTNQRAEIFAAIFALYQLPRGSAVEIHTDSNYVVQTMNGVWRRNTNLDAWDWLDEACARHEDVGFRWLRGHAGNPRQEIAHALVADALREKRPA